MAQDMLAGVTCFVMATSSSPRDSSERTKRIKEHGYSMSFPISFYVEQKANSPEDKSGQESNCERKEPKS